jgi:hypothetical protein
MTTTNTITNTITVITNANGAALVKNDQTGKFTAVLVGKDGSIESAKLDANRMRAVAHFTAKGVAHCANWQSEAAARRTFNRIVKETQAMSI